MKRLAEMVELFENNYECVMLKVKDGKEFDLMALGCFDGDEKMLRLTKGGVHTCTVWGKDNKSYSWHWGEGGHTLVSDSMNKMGKMIQDCIEDDFDIYIGKDDNRRKEKYNPNRSHEIKAMFANGGVCAHKDGEFLRYFDTLEDLKEHFKGLGYKLEMNNEYTAITGCKVQVYNATKN